ncbi:MAG TPA: SRPBCC family protein [Gammaproteobacteria bacterium]|nr:SRPBCC family protein [Gammaproteobacteria bacterium]
MFAAMHYEHLIQINDPDDPSIAPLSRAQLWRGLVRRAENPGEFLPGLDAMQVRRRGDDFLERELYFGARVIQDRITFSEPHSLHCAVEPGPEFPASGLVIRIEEPRPGHLFLRFVYDSVLTDGAEYESVVKQAWFQADLDTVGHIRGLASRGLLD